MESRGSSNIESFQVPEVRYGYQRLGPTKNEISLLKIPPLCEVDKVGSGVECSLFVTLLENATEYEVLSYTWGAQSNSKTILLDGQPFTVTQNLHSALWQLRVNSASSFRLTLFVSTRGNTLERSEQVSKMQTICQRAGNVVVWLGTQSRSTKLAFTLLELPYKHRLDQEEVAKTLREPETMESLAAMGNSSVDSTGNVSCPSGGKLGQKHHRYVWEVQGRLVQGQSCSRNAMVRS